MKNFFILLVSFIGLIGCSGQQQTSSTQSSTGYFYGYDSTRRVATVYLAADTGGGVGLVWVESGGKEAADRLFFAKWNPAQFSFDSKTLVVAAPRINTDVGNRPRLAFGGSGTIDIVYARDMPADSSQPMRTILLHRQSRDGGQTWSLPEAISRDTLRRHSRSHFDLKRLPDGTIGICWLDRSFGNGRSIMFNKTDTTNHFLPKGKFERLVDSFANPGSATALTVSGDGTVALAYRDFRNDETAPLAICTSPDLGLTFAPPRTTEAAHSATPAGQSDPIAIWSDSDIFLLGWQTAGKAWIVRINRTTGASQQTLLSGSVIPGRLNIFGHQNQPVVVYATGSGTAAEHTLWAKRFPDGKQVALSPVGGKIGDFCAVGIPDGLLAIWIQQGQNGQQIAYRKLQL